MEVPTTYKAYFSGLNFREYPQQNMALKNMVLTYLHLLDPEIPIDIYVCLLEQKCHTSPDSDDTMNILVISQLYIILGMFISI